MLDRFSETALNEAREYYKEHGAKEKVQNFLAKGIDLNEFILNVAVLVPWLPRLSDGIDDIYKTDKIKFYTTARNRKSYEGVDFLGKNLKTEVSMRRAFGVLLCSLDDEELLNKVIKLLDSEFLWAKNLSKKFNKEEFQKKALELSKNQNMSVKTPQDGSIALTVFNFLLFARNGYETRKTAIWEHYAFIDAIMSDRETKSGYEALEFLDSFDYTSNMTITKEFKKLENTLLSGGDLFRITEIIRMEREENNGDLDTRVPELRKLLIASCNNDNDECTQYDNLLRKVELFYRVLDFNGLNFRELLWQYKFNLEERERILKSICRTKSIIEEIPKLDAYNDVIENNGKNDSTALEILKYLEKTNKDIWNEAQLIWFENSLGKHQEKTIPDNINTLDYVLALLFHILAKALNESRTFYFKNNSETEFYEIQKYQDKTAGMELEIEKFNSALSEKDKEIEFLKKQIEDLKNAESKETKDIVKPYNEEISFLKKQVEDLKEKLLVEQEKTDELNKLRTFAFSVRSEDVVAEKEVSLSELIKDKKITIIGGHTNWQNKMKKKYPKLNLLDGHSTSFDLQTLTSSDFVLLYTGNMSHTVYYKMIDALRTSAVKYDYIGKYNNVNLLEQEIAEILK